VQIRQRTATDLDACVSALATVFATSGYPTRWPKDPHQWLNPPDVLEGWVAIADDGIAGHILVRSAGERAGSAAVAEVSRFFVAPSAQGGGLGGRLLMLACEWADEHGLPLELEVTEFNRAAVRLYERTGWRLTRSETASWTTEDGAPLLLHRYVRGDRARTDSIAP
jgi:GNAT superfamily N-acetyltransferase